MSDDAKGIESALNDAVEYRVNKAIAEWIEGPVPWERQGWERKPYMREILQKKVNDLANAWIDAHRKEIEDQISEGIKKAAQMKFSVSVSLRVEL